MTESVRGAVVVLLTSAAAVSLVFLAACLSVFLVFAIRTSFVFIAHIINVFGEIIVALFAAVTSASTITLTILLAAGAASMTFPASSLEARIGVSVVVSGASIVAAAAAVILLASLTVDWEIVSAIVSASAMAVAFAAAWAVGVMSLIEKETQQVGLKMTSILDAVRHNNHRVLRLLLKLHAGVKQRDMDLALLHAIKAGFPECTSVLLKEGANPNTRDSHENTPLILACETGCRKLAEVLLDAGGYVDIRNGSRGTALHQAAKWGYEDCIQLLLERGADPNIQDGLWRTPLVLAARHAHKPNNVICMLIQAGSDVNTVGTEQRTVLHYAAARGLDLQILLDAGANPHMQDTEGNAPLHHASMEGSSEALHTLLSVNCDPKLVNYRRQAPIHFAAMRGHIECLSALVNAGSNPHVPDSTGCTPMWYAASHGHSAAVSFFLRHNCPMQPYKDENGCALFVANPLNIALEKNYLAIVRLLLIGGCNPGSLAEWLAQRVPESCGADDEKQVDWFREFLSNTVTLSHLCRLHIRKQVGIRLMQVEKYLPLPTALRNFITMKELEHEQWTESPVQHIFYRWQLGMMD